MHIPLIANIKHNSLDDGPGIRTTVFFKGCPLSCVWCHNPECLRPGPDLAFRADQCIDCRGCVEACLHGAIGADGPDSLDRSLCQHAGACADQCPTGALELVGKRYAVDKLVTILCRDQLFYKNSGGGVTFSGGEATMFCDYAGAIAERLCHKGVHTLLETCGHFDWKKFATLFLPHLDTVYLDLKLADTNAHKLHCGRGNQRVLANLDRFLESVREGTVELLVRIPLVPNITCTAENLQAAAALLRSKGVTTVALLPYHPLWAPKAHSLGVSPRFHHEKWLQPAELAIAHEAFAGFTVT